MSAASDTDRYESAARRASASQIVVCNEQQHFLGIVRIEDLLTAMALPWLLNRLGLDPAFGSGPLATVIQDLLSITIYFAIATALI